MDWNLGRISELATGYWPAALLSAAVELGVFEALAARPADAAGLARRLETAERATGEMLDALAAVGLLEREAGGRYRLDAGAAPFLDPASSSCLLDALRFNTDLYPLWGRLAQAVRTGAPVIAPQAHLGRDASRTRRFAMGMHSRALGLAPALLPALDMAGCATLLDLGCGPGTFSRMLAERAPGLRVTQFDLPGVVEVARALAADSPAAARIDFRTGDYRRDDLGGPYDAALYCGALHQEDPATARELLSRVAGVLRPGGRVWVVDLMLESDRRGPPFAHLFSINMMLTSPIGRVFSIGEARRVLKTAGFTVEDSCRLGPLPYAVLRGRRRSSAAGRAQPRSVAPRTSLPRTSRSKGLRT